ncbi:aldo/keto reductase [Actinopolymorpha singaporensis]|uniref:Aldo/keto reductase n=1 Tax=Actinopolymorpha singaporensis TaxID=117157 RepID=A0A1H1T637_9ACTN|nr:aldo/keto reductase [Actinopolymorpha singaporensis]SDS55621.1 Aldo/keto reductase [Actinopolymorpha singaporensis]
MTSGGVTREGTRTVRLPSGEQVPALGQGTWGWAEDRSRRDQEVAALRHGLDLGLTLVDTAEMYADGGAEELVGEAVAGRRDEVFLVSKVLPDHGRRRDTLRACEASLRRLGTDHLDLYLLHWRGRVPLAETLEAFETLVAAGKIRYWGVSNFDTADLAEVMGLPGGDAVTTDQVLYNLTRRGVEYDLLPWAQAVGLPVMAYSPVEQGRLLADGHLAALAAGLGATPAQLALAWVLRHPHVVAIPRAGTPGHVEENRAAVDLRLTPDVLAALDELFPPPTQKVPLEVL